LIARAGLSRQWIISKYQGPQLVCAVPPQSGQTKSLTHHLAPRRLIVSP
jgi:hypothetical protein